MGPDILREHFPLLIPILGLMIPIVAILAHYISKNNRERERHATIRELARAGLPVPPELLGNLRDFKDSDYADSKARSPSGNLRGAVVNLSVGLGLMGMFYVMRPESWLWAIGLIPTCLGVGLLLLWWIERRPATSA